MRTETESSHQIPGPGGHEVRKAQKGEIPALARAIAHAFFEDPLSTFVMPDASSRMRISEDGVALFLGRAWLDLGETYVIGEPAAGACIWNPPGTWEIGIGKQLAMLPALIRAYGRNLPRLLSALNAAETDHPTRPHYYLPMLGVEPESQGRGMGSALMYPVLSRCDAEGIPAFLESSTPRNRALYERHGFEVTGQFKLGRGSEVFSRMWREPRSGA
jgi:ribosomal protein S18 acetylase RimI-like enzyme